MTNMICFAASYLRVLWVQANQRLVRRLSLVAVILLLVLITISPTAVSAYAGLGSYISEKLLGQAGNASSLYIGNSVSGPTVIGFGASISTGAVTGAVLPNSGPAIATLHGNLLSLSGFSSISTWFVWGDSPSTMTHTTATVVAATTGDKTAAISGYDPAGRVYYRFVASTDGVSYGSTESFTIGGGRGLPYWLLINLLTLLIAAVTLVLVIRSWGNYILMIILVIIGVLAIFIMRTFINSIL